MLVLRYNKKLSKSHRFLFSEIKTEINICSIFLHIDLKQKYTYNKRNPSRRALRALRALTCFSTFFVQGHPLFILRFSSSGNFLKGVEVVRKGFRFLTGHRLVHKVISLDEIYKIYRSSLSLLLSQCFYFLSHFVQTS